MSRAKDIYNQIKIRGITQIDDFINNQVSEELFLDYKCIKTKDGSTKLHVEDLANISKVISGFGNSDGGVVIWGVNCRLAEGRGDLPLGYQAKTVKVLENFNPLWLKSLVEGAVSGATLPPHQMVENFALAREDGSDAVLVTHIPEGMSTPFRAIHGDKDYYYIRSGSNFNPAPHGVLASLFGRRPQPILEVIARLQLDNGPVFSQAKSSLYINLSIQISNIGRGIAEDIFITFGEFSGPFKAQEHSFDFDTWQTERSEDKTWLAPAMMITKNNTLRIPPRAIIQVIKIDFIYKSGIEPFMLKVFGGCSTGPGFYADIIIDSESIRTIVDVYEHAPNIIPGRSGDRKEIDYLLNKDVKCSSNT